MTFDEAIEELRLAIPEKFYSPTLHDIAVMLEAQTKVINLLREEYAPTIEMTTFERTNAVGLLDFKRDELTFVVGSNGDGTPILDTLPKEYFSAWLHPETIKIVDE
ncbi:hypothetical protein [Leuconostoc mesenteroides]|uniref:hypothetical protein n=1 Tax=Leuconostoc mesenteroides TaxID=1245 RepID=UPI002362A47A|nr:hypothetical protein [Leuconostoc mesenteroides]